MNIFIILYAIIIIYMFFNFRYAFLLHVVFKILLNQNINLINSPDLPLLTLELAVNTIFIFYFFLKKKYIYTSKESFPFLKAFYIVFFSILISTFFSSVGFFSAISRAVQEIINSYIFVYIFWKILQRKRDIRYVLKVFVGLFLIISIYGFYERITGTNPVMEYEISLNVTSNKTIDWAYSEDSRLGLGRVRSFILHPIGFGVYLAVFLSSFLFINSRYESFLKPNIIIKVLLIVSMIACLFFTNSRSPIVYFIIVLFGVFDFRRKQSFQPIVIGIAGLVFGIQYIRPYFPIIESIFNPTEYNVEIGGSTIDMRISQFNIAIYSIVESPIVGLGIKSLDRLKENVGGLYGAESIWLWLIIERGAIGVISYIVLLISFFKIGKRDTKLFVRISTFAWLILTTITSIPGSDISFFMIMLIIINRMRILKEKSVLEKSIDKSSVSIV